MFTVGVGHAVSEAFVRGLAAATGGACKLVSPGECMAERIVRHFERLRAPRARRATVHWPDGAVGITPRQIDVVFDGDTLVASARFDRPPAHGNVTLEIETETGEILRQDQAIPGVPASEDAGEFSTVARIAATMRIKEADEATGRETALRYRLVSPWTHWLVVIERADDARTPDLPALRRVPHTLAAGWGGVGGNAWFAMASCSSADAGIPYDLCEDADFCLSEDFLFSAFETARPVPVHPFSGWLPRLLELIATRKSPPGITEARSLLEDAGLADEFAGIIERAVELGVTADAAAAIILACLLDELPEPFLTDELCGILRPFRQWASAADAALRGLTARDGRFNDLVRELTASGVLSWPAEALADERTAAFGDLLERIDEAVREVIEDADHEENRRSMIADAP